jgi:DNA-binding LytR/AlgR family response regulator
MESITINNKTIVDNKLNEIVFLESVGDFTKKYCCNGKEFLVEDKLNSVEETLPNQKFFKISYSYIINADYLKIIKVRPIKIALLQGDIELNIDEDKYGDFIRFLKLKYNIW